MRLPIEQALRLRCVKVYCDGARLRVVASGYSAPYALNIDNLAQVYDAGMVCKIVPALEGASVFARVLVDW